jgi:hypothetical protein
MHRAWERGKPPLARPIRAAHDLDRGTFARLRNLDIHPDS